MKIAIITSGFLPVIDGVTISGLHRVKYLSQWGHDVILLCPDYSDLANVYPHWPTYTGEIFRGVRVINLESHPFMGLDFERNINRKGHKTLLKELEAFQPDIIHVDEPERIFLGTWQVPGLGFARKHNIPCISFFRTNFLEYIEDFFPLKGYFLTLVKALCKWLIVWIYNQYDLTLIHSRVTHRKLVHLGINNSMYAELSGFDANAFDSALRSADFFDRVYQLPEVDKKIKLVFLGRLTSDKGWRFTLEALNKVTKTVDLKNVAFLVAGDGPMHDEIAERLSAFSPHAHLLGRVPPEAVPALLINSDIHVTTSEKETLGLTILEAFASGIPVLAPNAGGVIENVRHGENGLLFHPQDPQDFADKLQKLIQDDNMRQRMGWRAMADIKHYNWEQAVANLAQIWQKQIALNH